MAMAIEDKAKKLAELGGKLDRAMGIEKLSRRVRCRADQDAVSLPAWQANAIEAVDGNGKVHSIPFDQLPEVLKRFPPGYKGK